MDGEDAPLNDQVELDGHFISTILDARYFYVAPGGEQYDHRVYLGERWLRVTVALDHEVGPDGKPVVITGSFRTIGFPLRPSMVGERWRAKVSYNRANDRSEIVGFSAL